MVSSSGNGGIRAVPWGAGDVLLGIAIVIVGVVIAFVVYALIIYLALDADPDSTIGITVVAGVAYWIAFATCWVVGPLRYRTSIASLGLRLLSSEAFPRVIFQTVLVLAGSLGFSLLYAGVLFLLGLDEYLPDQQTQDIVLEGPAIIASIGLVVFWGPLVEETFFRAFVFPGLTPWMGLVGAAIASSLLFAVIHGDPWVMVPVFVIGLLLAWLYHRTGSILVCFSAHAMWNGLILYINLAV